MATDSATNNLNTSTSSNLTSAVKDIVVSNDVTDAAQGSDETFYQHEDFSKWFGYYTNIPEVKIAIDTRAIWTAGKKYTTDDYTEVILSHVMGWGQDTFQTVLQNMIVTRRICGDAFAEIIRDPDDHTLVNLKPLDPSTIKIVVDKKGTLKRYEQVNKNGDTKTYDPTKIFHLINKRVADEIHGRSDIESIEPIVQAMNENFKDMKQVFHRHVKPIMAFKLDTDDQTKINTFMAKMDQIIAKGENIYIPKDTVEFELVTVPSSATLSPFQWIDHLKNYFYQVVGIPQIILGNASEFSESSAKIAYLSFQQSVEAEQLDIENQVYNQLGLQIELDFPATIQNEMISDTSKDGANAGMNFQPNETTLNMENQDGAEQ